jgi:uncharacterized protein (TIGR03000 family)
MFRRLLLPLAALGLLSTAGPSAAAAEEAGATVIITLPPDAWVYFDDSPTKQTGAVRTFTTPDLKPGKTYRYRLIAEVNRHGTSYTLTRKITVRTGETTRVDLGDWPDRPGAYGPGYTRYGPVGTEGRPERPAGWEPRIAFEVKRGSGGADRWGEPAYSPDRRTVVKVLKSGLDLSVRLYDAATDEPVGPKIHVGRGGYVTGLAVAPDGKTVATALGNTSKDSGSVWVWDATTGEQVAFFNRDGYLGQVYTLAFSRDGRTVKVTSGEPGGK